MLASGSQMANPDYAEDRFLAFTLRGLHVIKQQIIRFLLPQLFFPRSKTLWKKNKQE